jgi:hypothetical protein
MYLNIPTIAALIGILTGLIKIGQMLYSIGNRLGKLELKVETMWAFQMRRAVSEVISKGAATIDE